MTGNNKPDKQVKISYDKHRELKKLAVKEDKEMRHIIEEAFDLYVEKYYKKGNQT